MRLKAHTMPPPEASPTDCRLAYARISWHTFLVHGIRDDGECTCGKPDCKTPGKHPISRGRNRGTTMDPDRVSYEGVSYPDANVAAHLRLSGLACIDVDPRNGGDETLARLEREHGRLDAGIVAETGGGGTHHFFRVPTDHKLLPCKGSLGPGIDVLSGNQYPVLAPSKHKSGAIYRWRPGCDPWENGFMLSPLPSWVTERANRKPVGTVVTDDLSEATPEKLARLRSALNSIPADERDTWLRIGAALHNASGGGADGRELWDEWSAGSDDFDGCPQKYDPADQNRTWQSFDVRRADGVTVGSIFYEAKQYGWIDPRRPAYTDEDVDAMLTDDTARIELNEDRYRLYTPAECAEAPSRGYIVKNLIAPCDVGCIFGPPGTGKSLLAPCLGYMIALGLSAFGMRVRQGKVLYVAAEDLHGIRGRVTALRVARGDTDDFLVMGGISDLRTEGSPDWTALRATVEAHRPALIVLDTVAMAFPGLKENEAEEMSRVVAVARSLTNWEAAVVLVHHDTKARDGTPRGHGVLNGALDFALCLDPMNANGIVRARLTKNRNGPVAVQLGFRIEIQHAGEDEDGDPIRLPLAVEVPSEISRPPMLSRSERGALDALVEIARLSDGPVLIGRWQAACEQTRVVSDADKRASRSKAFARAVRELARKDLICTDASYAWPTSMPERAPDFEPFDSVMDEGDAL